MNHVNILKRALNITVNYRVLWIFGILLALTASGGGGGNGGGSGSSSGNPSSNNGSFPSFNGTNPFEHFPNFNITPEITNIIIAIAIGLGCLIVILAVVGTFVRYISETAVIRMVAQHEKTGEKLTFWQGLRLGWSRAAWRMFLMNLLTGISFLLAFIIAASVAALPLLAWLTKNTPLEVLGTVISVGLLLLVFFATILVALALSLVMLLAQRACALEDLGVIDSLRRGFVIAKAHLVDLILMGAILFGISLLWGLVMIFVSLAFLVAAAIVAGLPALLVGALVATFTQGVTPWIVAGLVAAPIFLIAISIPLALINGWKMIFSSTAWTLSYREVLALDQTKQNGDQPAAPAELAAPAAA
jgi:hypothetical protein